MAKPLGSLGWLEHHSGDSEKAQSFYHGLIGYDAMEPCDMGDHNDYSAMRDGEPVFGLIQKFKNLENFTGWMPYLIVDDLDAALARAVELGAEVVHPISRQEGCAAGWCAVKDPCGALVALYQE